MYAKIFVYRARQYLLSIVQPLIPWKTPALLSGSGSLLQIPEKINYDGIRKVLIVTTKGLVRRGSLDGLFKGLESRQIEYAVFDEVQPDPTIDSIEDAVGVYGSEKCEAIIAVGGGSVIDCSKVIGARAVKPDQSILQMAGLFKLEKVTPLYAVPTTAGTGAEVTVAAVVTDGKNHYKYPINDTSLIPKYAVLDPDLTLSLPQKLTATTGMDALTHAVEAYINRYGSQESKKHALEAVRMIFASLKNVYDDGTNLEKRTEMLTASYYAGLAFTKSYVGYVHSIAHGVGGLYGLSHGYANAVILPVVLRAYGEPVYGDLAALSDVVGIQGITDKEKAEKFIVAIEEMNRHMDIPSKLGVIKDDDVEEIVSRALKEANPTYPVPVIWDEAICRSVVETL